MTQAKSSLAVTSVQDTISSIKKVTLFIDWN